MNVGTVNHGVPCDGCVRCCIGDAVRLLHEDFDDDGNPRFRFEKHPTMPRQLMIAHKADKSCVYLGENGCTIHDDKPQMCKNMDCRNIALNISFTQARKMAKKGHLRMGVWKRGKELINRNKEESES